MDRADLERLDRESLVVRATDAGIRRARLLTRPELVDELLRLDPAQEEGQLKRTRGFFGRARDLLTKVVERGLHLPDAADRWASALGTTSFPQVPRPEPLVVPTVTLAEIYAAQGHKKRAIDTLRRVLEAEPEHRAARALLDRLEAIDYVPPPPPLPPEPDEPAKDGNGAHLGTSDDEEEEEPFADTMEQPIFRNALEDGDTQTLWLPDEAETASFLPGDELVPTEPAPRVVAPAPVAVAIATAVPDHDICVAIPLDAGQVCYVWWKLGASTRARLEAEPAFLFLRAVSYVPSWDGPVETVHDLTIDPAAGEAVVRELPRDGIVRIAIGTREDGVFSPLAHSPALETVGVDLVEWTPEGNIPRGRLEDPRSIASVKSAVVRLVAHDRS